MEDQSDKKPTLPKVPWHKQPNLPWYKVVLGTIGVAFEFVLKLLIARSSISGFFMFAKPPDNKPWYDQDLPLAKRLRRASIPLFGPLMPVLVLVTLLALLLLVLHFF